MMQSLEDLRNALPEYAKDIKLNLSNLAAEETLNPNQLWGTYLACAMATKQRDVIEAISNEAANHIGEDVRGAACGAATIMAMNNVYYRGVHLMSNKEYQSLPAKLRMTFIAGHGTDKVDFELWCFAVSAINGCGMCMDAHEAQLKKEGMTPEQIQAALRIAATVNAAAATMESAKCACDTSVAAAA